MPNSAMVIAVVAISITIASLTASQIDTPMAQDMSNRTKFIVESQKEILENTEQITELKQKIVNLSNKMDRLQNTIENFNQTGKHNP